MSNGIPNHHTKLINDAVSTQTDFNNVIGERIARGKFMISLQIQYNIVFTFRVCLLFTIHVFIKRISLHSAYLHALVYFILNFVQPNLNQISGLPNIKYVCMYIYIYIYI